MEDERSRILRMIQAGRISAEDGSRLLESIEGSETPESEPVEASPASVSDPEAPPAGSWGHYWVYILAMGMGISLLGVSLLMWLQSQLGFTFWSVCCSLPLMLGLLVIAIAAWSTHSSWVHVRITDLDTGRRDVAVSVPLPLTLTIWTLRIARHFVRDIPDQGIEEVLEELARGGPRKTPLTVDVVDDKERKRVQVRIV